MAPGVADALDAKLVQRHGFEAIYMTGAGTTAVRLGMPDVGLLTMTEMVDNAAPYRGPSGLPLIADADNGYRRGAERPAHDPGVRAGGRGRRCTSRTR